MPKPPPFGLGARVEVHGLVGRTDLNGSEGVQFQEDAVNGRVVVLVDRKGKDEEEELPDPGFFTIKVKCVS